MHSGITKRNPIHFSSLHYWIAVSSISNYYCSVAGFQSGCILEAAEDTVVWGLRLPLISPSFLSCKLGIIVANIRRLFQILNR